MKSSSNLRHRKDSTSEDSRPSRVGWLMTLGLCIVAGVWPSAGLAQPSTLTNYSVSLSIPDNDPSGISSTKTFSSGITFMSNLKVTLQISGDYNGDLYAYLTHGSGFTVLLNRVGRTAADPFGYADSGFDVTFDDSAANGDIHSYQATSDPAGGTLTGIWAPDGRNIDPANAFDTTPRSTFLNSFAGMDPNGDWTLFIADLSPAGTSVLDNWGLEAVGVVPEPATWGLLLFGSGALVMLARRRRGA